MNSMRLFTSLAIAVMLLTVGVATAQKHTAATHAATTFDIYPVPESVRRSNIFAVQVSADSLTWHEVPVIMALTADGHGSEPLPANVYAEFNGLERGHHVVRCAIASLSVSDKTWVRVKHLQGARRLELSPEKYEIPCHHDTGSITFAVEREAKFLVRPDGDVVRTLSLLIDNRSNDKPSMRGFDHIIRFKAGYHTADNSRHITLNEHGAPVIPVCKDNTLIVLDKGAHVCAAIDVCGAQGVKICGHGYINLLDRCCGAASGFEGEWFWAGFRKNVVPAIYIHQNSSHIDIEDITIISDFRDITVRNASDIDVRNVKMFSSANNADGINLINTQRFAADNCYIHSQDDCFCAYNSCDSIRFLWDDQEYITGMPTSDLRLTNSTVWTTCRPFVFGGHGTGSLAPRDVIENILVEGCTIVGIANALHYDFTERNQRTRTFWSGIFRILSQSEQIVRNITFRNVDVEWSKGYDGQPIHIAVRDAKRTSYGEGRGYRIENIRFENISFRHPNERIMPIYMRAPTVEESSSADYGIFGVEFQNVTIGGRPYLERGILSIGNVDLRGKK